MSKALELAKTARRCHLIGVANELERLHGVNADLLEALQVLADIPIKSFGKETKPDYPLMGWNDKYLYVRDVLAARAAIKKATE